MSMFVKHSDYSEPSFWGVLFVLTIVALAVIFTKVYPWYMRCVFMIVYVPMVCIAYANW